MSNKAPTRFTTPPPPPGLYEKALSLTTDIATLEVQMNQKMTELNELLRSIDEGALPGLMVDLLKRSGPVASSALSTLPVASLTPTMDDFGVLSLPIPTTLLAPKPVYAEGTFEARIIELMADGRERRAGAIIKSLKAKGHKSSVYHALRALVVDGVLLKPAYGHYRKP